MRSNRVFKILYHFHRSKAGEVKTLKGFPSWAELFSGFGVILDPKSGKLIRLSVVWDIFLPRKWAKDNICVNGCRLNNHNDLNPGISVEFIEGHYRLSVS